MNSSQQATLNQAIKLLQSLLSPSQTAAGPVSVPIPQYDSQIESFYQKGHSLESEVQQLTEIFQKASNTMKTILSYSLICKKYSSAQEQKLKNIFISLSNEVEGVIKKNPNFIDHCKAIKQILSATFWVFVPTPEFIIKGAIEAADFNALKFQKKKVKDHNDWWALITGACKNLQKYVVKHYPMGLNFNVQGNDLWDQILSGKSQKSEQQTAPEQKQTQDVKSKQTEQKVAPKQPKKQMVGLTWEIRYFQNQTINLGPQIQMKHGIFIQNCSNCLIKIDSKFKSLQLNKCDNVKLEVKSCVSGLELMNSKNLTLVVREKTPSISVDKSERVNLLLNDHNIDTDIVSCKASELNVTVLDSKGEESKPHLISDQLITKWNPKTKKFQTGVYDKFL